MPDYEVTPVGKWLREQRESIGWSQTDLSWEARIATTMISQFERGRYQPNIKTLERLVQAMARGGANCTLPWLVQVGDKRRKLQPANTRAPDLREVVAV